MTSFRSCFLRGLVLFLFTGATTPFASEESNRELQETTIPPVTEGVQDALDEALALWNSSVVDAYTFEFQRHCHCLEEYRAPYVVTVEFGTVVEVLGANATMLEPENPLFQDAYTLEALFAKIQSAVDQGAYSIVVEYNATYGYPESIYIDYDAMIADEEFSLVVNAFELMEVSEGGQDALDEALALWNSSVVDAYTFEFQRQCECLEENRAPYVVTVELGAVIEVVGFNATMLEPENPLFQAAYTVDALFALIQSALDQGAYSVVVEYNATYGYPESIYIDYDAMIADEEFILAVNAFELMALSEGGPETLDEAMAIWNSSGVEAYTFEFQRLCQCTEEYRAPYVTTVESGAVVAVAYVNATMLEPENELYQSAYTVEALFAKIQSALDQGVYSIVVEYNETYGFPESIYIDYNVMTADEEFSLVVNSFELLEAAKGGQDSETGGEVSSISPSVAPRSSSPATPSAPAAGTRDSALAASSATTLCGSGMILAHLGRTMVLLSGLLVIIE